MYCKRNASKYLESFKKRQAKIYVFGDRGPYKKSVKAESVPNEEPKEIVVKVTKPKKVTPKTQPTENQAPQNRIIRRAAKA